MSRKKKILLNWRTLELPEIFFLEVENKIKSSDLKIFSETYQKINDLLFYEQVMRIGKPSQDRKNNSVDEDEKGGRSTADEQEIREKQLNQHLNGAVVTVYHQTIFNFLQNMDAKTSKNKGHISTSNNNTIRKRQEQLEQDQTLEKRTELRLQGVDAYTNKDLDKAIELFNQAAQLGDIRAGLQYVYIIFLKHNSGNPLKALEIFRAMDNYCGIFGRAFCYLHGIGLESTTERQKLIASRHLFQKILKDISLNEENAVFLDETKKYLGIVKEGMTAFPRKKISPSRFSDCIK